MGFVFQPLTWAFLLVAVPVLIHLINMMRHRRVKWAAMDFLLKAYKRQRTWIWLKQLLLLATRMLIVAAVVALLAKPRTREQWLSLFGEQTTHHYVLLDDSYSMSEVVGGVSAFERAQRIIHQIVDRAAEQPSRQKFTLVRLSRAAAGAAASAPGEEPAEGLADLNAEPVGPALMDLLEQRRRQMDVTQLAVGPGDALAVVRQLMQQQDDEIRVLYLLSDFRTNEWQNPAELREALRQFERFDAQVQLVQCADPRQQPNLGIVDLSPAEGTRAAGVPLFVNLKVKNHGVQAVKDVPVRVRSHYFDPKKQDAAAAGGLEGERDDLPTVLIEQIGPGETVTRRVQVYFPGEGRHVVEATLPHDPVEADNRRFCVVDFPPGVPVLVIDGDPQQQNAYYLESVFRPGERTRTGIAPDVQPPVFLRDTSLEELAAYQAVYLLDVPRLDGGAAALLEEYVRQGGGLAVFLGPEAHLDFYNQLHRDGEGMFPVRLDRADLLPPPVSEGEPDFVAATPHPVFRLFEGESNPFLRGILVDQYVRAHEEWQPDAETTSVLLRLRNRMPLVVERQWGEGRVLAVMTTLAPQWNNWARHPSYIVVLLEMQSHLAMPARTPAPRLVGSPVEVQLDAAQFRQDVTFFAPAPGGGGRVRIDRNAAAPAPDSPILTAAIGVTGPARLRSGETDYRGVYEAWAYAKGGGTHVYRFAVNVDPLEGDTTIVPPRQLAEALAPLKFELHQADQFEYQARDQDRTPWSEMLLALLIFILLAEQALAYSASYHPAPGGAA